jgi:RecB family endonuclease NucS
MLKIDRKEQTLSRLGNYSLGKADITERYDLQEFISNSPKEFFGELGEDLFLIGKEIEPSTRVQDRIDLLAFDREGHSVIIELKRGNHKLQMMQAIAYAAMIADWTAEDFRALLSDQQLESLERFLSVQLEDVNQSQRVILVAEGFDFSLLAAA